MTRAFPGHGDFAAFADGFDALAFDDDDRVFHRRPAGGVDERAALDDQRRRFLRVTGKWQGERHEAEDTSYKKLPDCEVSFIVFHVMLGSYLLIESIKPLFSNCSTNEVSTNCSGLGSGFLPGTDSRS